MARGCRGTDPQVPKDKRLLTSYRPTALTSSVCKLAERLIQARLAFVAETRGLIPDKQVGFRAKQSAEKSIGHDPRETIVLSARKATRLRSTYSPRITSAEPTT